MQNLSLYRLAIFNIICFIGVIWAWALGYIQYIYDGDVTKIVVGCAIVFIILLISTFNQAIKIARKAFGNLTLFLERQKHIAEGSEWLVTIGLIGTVVGIAVAMGGVDSAKLETVEGTREAVSHVFQHLHVAFNVTITGAVLALWNGINSRILSTAVVEALTGDEH